MENILFNEILVKIHNKLLEREVKVSFAESCTGGLLQKLITETSGSSSYFEGGFVTYSNRIKEKILKVNNRTLVAFGAVSSECAEEMVNGVKLLTDADICVSVTGIAGPTGGSAEKPVGTVWFGFNILENSWTTKKIFAGTRGEVREQAAYFVLSKILEKLGNEEK